MSTHQIKYELLRENTNSRHKHTYIQVCLLVALCAMSSIAVFVTWTVIYRKHVNIPPKLNDIPAEWPKRAILYAKQMHESSVLPTNHNPPVRLDAVNHTIFGKSNFSAAMPAVKQLDDNEKIYPSKLGNFIYKPASAPVTKLVCYYFAADKPASLRPQDIHPNLCTHINIGIALIRDNRIVITDVMRRAFDEVNELKRQNKHLKVLVWVGGGGDQSGGFPEMVQNHANRKLFIQSLKDCLETHHIDGIDLDWEFPSAYQRERQHFTQLLHEIRREYQREHRTYLLSVAAAALEGIAYFSYDITELNNYVDYVNLMTYDYHFYTKETPFTGLNAPLYRRQNERYFLGTLNINTSVNYWLTQGLDKSKIVIGLPTYGHSFKLVNPFNGNIMSPAEGYGDVGDQGFVTYSDVCWFKRNNYLIQNDYDTETCSPYLHSGTEWISYENERSIECKTKFIRDSGVGGAMLFSLNTDDFLSYCDDRKQTSSMPYTAAQLTGRADIGSRFPLLRKAYWVLFGTDVKDT